MRSDLWNWQFTQDSVVLFSSNEGTYPGDGHHRILAAREAQIPLVYAEVRAGTLLDARLYALQANTNHGLPLRTKDNRSRVEKLVDLIPQLPQHSWGIEEMLQFLKLPRTARQTVEKIWTQS